MPAGELNDSDWAAMMATLRDIARHRLEGRDVELFGGRGRFTVTEFHSERQALLERMAKFPGEAQALAQAELSLVALAKFALACELDQRVRAVARVALPSGGRSAHWLIASEGTPNRSVGGHTLRSEKADAPLLRGPGLPRKAPSGLSWEAWRVKADDLIRRRAKGETWLAAAIKNDVSDDTAQRWVRWRREELKAGRLLG